MNHHLRILQQRIQPIAVIRKRALVERKRRGPEAQHAQKEHLHPGQDRTRIRVELYIGLVREAKDKPIRPQQPRPQEQRTLLPAHNAANLYGPGSARLECSMMYVIEKS